MSLFLLLLLTSCNNSSWNNPYPFGHDGNILYSSFSVRPKHLDPARSYSSDEYAILGQVYEPPLQYHYLKRPYELEPLTAKEMPKVRYLDSEGNQVEEGSQLVTFTEYVIDLQSAIRYQPHPAFVKDNSGRHAYLNMSPAQIEQIFELSDFTETASRELTAADYVYQIKRLANPAFHSPILGLMGEYIVGLSDLAKQLKADSAGKDKQDWLDLRKYPVSGVKVINDYQYSIRIKGLYPQFIYWLSMPFFAPMPYEVERFFQQPGLIEKNITLDWYPVGTGAFYLAVNNPNKQMVLKRNPEFRGMAYPDEGEMDDEDKGLLVDAGKTMPFIDQVVFSLEKESIPYWNKFLQGYYDTSGISSDSFDQAVSLGSSGDISLTDSMQEMGIRLNTSIKSSIHYFGFNMLDDVVGGNSESARKLRRAIAIAVDYEEYISIFLNGRGVPAQSPIPPGIFGFDDTFQGINSEVYEVVDGQPKRRSIEYARELLTQAGYKNGVDPDTDQPLILYLDDTGSGPDAQANLAWWRKQFEKLNIQLVIRNTDYNRFRGKMEKGTAQMYQWGWNADYPDPENFLFLLYGPNGKVASQGENASNYKNAEFDQLFDKMKDMKNGPERKDIIKKMVQILRHDSPWLWGFYPKSFSLSHAWYSNSKPNAMAHNTLMYKRIDAELRRQQRIDWNHPVVWPVILLFFIFLISIIPAWRTWKRSETESQIKLNNGMKG